VREEEVSRLEGCLQTHAQTLAGGSVRPQFTELEAHYSAMDLLPLKTLCAFCEWSCEGSALECRERAAQHRAKAHPEAVNTRTVRKGTHLKSFRQPKLKKKEMEEIYAERDKRAKLIGIEITD
jgi:hypothetical protein